MGLMMLQLFQLRGASMVAVVDTRNSILDLARELGATHALNPRDVDVEKAVREWTDGKGVDIGVEAAGNQATLDLTSKVVRMEGKLEVFGFHQGGTRQVDWGYWNWMAFQIVNGHTRTQSAYVDGMRVGLDLVGLGKLNMTPLVTHTFPVDDINLAFETAAAKGEDFVKGVVVFETE
jgi:threonine dehydrogenase-like Zn-dependent dehydrogenase